MDQTEVRAPARDGIEGGGKVVTVRGEVADLDGPGEGCVDDADLVGNARGVRDLELVAGADLPAPRTAAEGGQHGRLAPVAVGELRAGPALLALARAFPGAVGA